MGFYFKLSRSIKIKKGEFMKVFQDLGLVGSIVAVSVSLQAILSAIRILIQQFEPDPEKQAADAKLKLIDKILAFFGKVIDIFQGNVKH